MTTEAAKDRKGGNSVCVCMCVCVYVCVCPPSYILHLGLKNMSIHVTATHVYYKDIYIIKLHSTQPWIQERC